MFKLKIGANPKWYEVRKQLSRFLVYLAGKINPKCPYKYTYYLEQTMKAQMDAMTYGRGEIEIKHRPFKETFK